MSKPFAKHLHHQDDPWLGSSAREYEFAEMLRIALGLLDAIRGDAKFDARLKVIEHQQTVILERVKTMADKSAELKQSQDDLADAFKQLATDIDNQLAIIANPGTPDQAVEDAITRARALTASMKEKAVALEADDTKP